MRILTSLALILALVGPSTATHCPSYSTSTPEVSAAGFYFDNDLCQPGCDFFIFWIYQESNGIPGLQRQDEIVDDTCHGSVPGDTIVF